MDFKNLSFDISILEPSSFCQSVHDFVRTCYRRRWRKVCTIVDDVLICCKSEISHALFTSILFARTDMVSHSLENCLAVAFTVIVWRPEVCGDEAQDVSQRHLEILHLVHQLRLVERAQVMMTPAVPCYLRRWLKAIMTTREEHTWCPSACMRLIRLGHPYSSTSIFPLYRLFPVMKKVALAP